MKTFLFILSYLITLLIAGCTKHTSCCILPKPPNQISAKKNGSDWHGPSQIAYKTPASTDTVILTAHVGEENINFILKKVSTNSYSLTDAGFFTTVGQDVIVNNYSLVKSANNQFSTIVSDNGKVLEGTFSLNFTRVYGNPATAYPDTLSFKSGFYKATWQ
jgi:hypothetical protein